MGLLNEARTYIGHIRRLEHLLTRLDGPRRMERKGRLLIKSDPSLTSWVKSSSPPRHMPGAMEAMKARQVQVMYVRAAGLMRHRRLDLGASRMVPEPGAVALGNQPCAGKGRCRGRNQLRKARSSKGRNEASQNK